MTPWGLKSGGNIRSSEGLLAFMELSELVLTVLVTYLGN
jgi:hypothetical protein